MAQMEVSYSRRLDYQYMMIETDEEARSDYRLSMLINNRINGFLSVHVQQMNGKSTLSYEITSLEDLPEFLDARKITSIAVLQCSFRGRALFARRRRNIT